MADIVRLEEKGIVQYVETHIGAVEGLGYVGIPVTFKAGFSNYSTSSSLNIYSFVDNIGIVSGAFTLSKDIEKGASAVIGTIPEKYAPSTDVHIVSHGSGSAIFLFTVATNGNLILARYKRGAEEGICYSGSWLAPSGAYVIKQ